MKHKLLIVVAAASFLAGCANPKAANSNNFTVALNGYFQSQHGACTKTTRYPTQLVDPNGGDPAYAQSWALTQVGLLNLKRTTHLVDYGFFQRPQNNYDYSLSAKGKAFWHGDKSEFCFAGLHVDRVVNFTEPVASSELGGVMSQVKYTYFLTDVAPWAKNTSARKYLGGIDSYLTGQRRAVMTQRLILTDKGWQVWNELDGVSETANQ